jgi:hypothetical protein
MRDVVWFGLVAVGALAAVIFALRFHDWATYGEGERRWDAERGYQRVFDLPWPAAVAVFAILTAWLM